MPPPEYLHTVNSYYGEKPLAWPATEIVQDLIADAREAGFNAPYFEVISGFRTYAQQDRLFQKALKKYGSDSAAREWVAPPGKSAHNTGYTFDLYLGGPTKSEAVSRIRQDPAYKYMRDVLAPKYNLAPYTTEPWHWECDKACRATYIMNKYGLDGELARQIVDEELIVPQGNIVAYLEASDGGDSQMTEGGQRTKSKLGKVLLATALVGGASFGVWLLLKRRGGS
jgi:hypothetical protein